LADQRVENVLFFTNPQSRLAWQFGGVADVAMGDRLSVQPALLLSSKGPRYESGIVGVDYNIRYRPLYLHLPIPVLGSTDVGEIRVFGGIGPYVSIGLGGKVVVEGDIDAIGFDFEGDEPNKWGDDFGDHYRGVDAGLLFTVGAEPAEGVQLALTYEQGLTNIAPNGNDNNIVRNRVLNLTTTFFLIR
jgi:hypothetical protein